jgi:hypothetical protein
VVHIDEREHEGTASAVRSVDLTLKIAHAHASDAGAGELIDGRVLAIERSFCALLGCLHPLPLGFRSILRSSIAVKRRAFAVGRRARSIAGSLLSNDGNIG